jgi:hypothetical protein
MQITARVDWGEVFARPGATPTARSKSDAV